MSGTDLSFISCEENALNYPYHVLLIGNNLYREIPLGFDQSQVRVGTGMGCEVRLHKE